MRAIWLTGAAVMALIGAPAAVADATADKVARDLLNNPQVCGEAGPQDQSPAARMVMVDGFGAGGFKVDTADAETQRWFDHGVKLRWAFEHSESVRAFRKARLLDPRCGMCAWGEAWAMGPNLNGGGGSDAVQADALRIARDARRLAQDAAPVQRQMIDALIQRYSGPKARRAARFATAMEALQRRNPDDVTISNITADALMLADYDWWNKDGTAKSPLIPRAMRILEHTLGHAPNDTGAIHLYIHLTEWSADPHKAIPYGERLASLAPGASHLVHMPSHTYYRVGRYKDAMTANVNAVALDKRYNELAGPPGGITAMPLHGHNLHFGMGGALMAGGAEQGLALAQWFFKTYPDVPASNLWRQIAALDAYALYGRFGSVEQVANLPQPPATKPVMLAGWRYARGEAAARRGEVGTIGIEAEALDGLRQAVVAAKGPRSEDAARLIEVMQRVLEGRAAMLDGDFAAAETAYARAAVLQADPDGEGGDPPVWWYPTRRSLAAALLAKGDAAGAKDKTGELLKEWPNDPYSYFVLAEAEAKLGDTAAAEAARAKSRTEWLGDAMSLTAA